MDGDSCIGVLATRGSDVIRYGTDSVVIADGGFQSNEDLLRRYISPSPERLLQRNAGTGRGDGLLMAHAVGAALTDMECFYGHVQARCAQRLRAAGQSCSAI